MMDLGGLIGKKLDYRDLAVVDPERSRFLVSPGESLAPQFSSLYFTRLAMLRPAVLETAADLKMQASENFSICQNSLEVARVSDELDCVVAGSLFKIYPRYQHVVPGLFDNVDTLQEKFREEGEDGKDICFFTAEDEYILEDEHGRIRLKFRGAAAEQKDSLVHGLVIGVRGRFDRCSGLGDFLVDQIILPGLAPAPTPKKEGSRGILAVVSGLSLGGDVDGVSSMNITLLTEFLTGFLGESGDNSLAASISCLVLAGNSLESLDSLNKLTETSMSSKKKGEEAIASKSQLLHSVKELDAVLARLSTMIQIVLLPGPSDPTTLSLPQQPIHRHLLPNASSFSSFQSLSNPCCFNVDGVSVLATAGNAVEDVRRFQREIQGNTTSSILESMLKWRHIAPTTPDTLPCLPFSDLDPFVLTECPNIFISGNSRENHVTFSKVSSSTITLGVPRFSSSGSVALVDLNTLEVSSMKMMMQ